MVSVQPLVTRRFVIGGALAAGIRPAYAVHPSADLSFLVVGDWGVPNESTQRVVASAMDASAEDLHSAFVISTGDNFYRDGVRSTSDRQWQDSFENVYSAPSLQTPWYVVLGNHDYGGSVAAQVNYTQTSSRWRMPARYWRQDIALPDGAAVAFFFLDTTPIAHLRGLRDAVPYADFGARQQLSWLERELSACRAPWKLGVGHHPIFSSGQHGPSAGLVEHVRPLLERHGVQAYFNGHDHNLEHLHSAGVDYICSGSGARVRNVGSVAESRFAAAAPGFVACTFAAEGLRVRFIDQHGVDLHEMRVTRTP